MPQKAIEYLMKYKAKRKYKKKIKRKVLFQLLNVTFFRKKKAISEDGMSTIKTQIK